MATAEQTNLVNARKTAYNTALTASNAAFAALNLQKRTSIAATMVATMWQSLFDTASAIRDETIDQKTKWEAIAADLLNKYYSDNTNAKLQAYYEANAMMAGFTDANGVISGSAETYPIGWSAIRIGLQAKKNLAVAEDNRLQAAEKVWITARDKTMTAWTDLKSAEVAAGLPVSVPLAPYEMIGTSVTPSTTNGDADNKNLLLLGGGALALYLLASK